MRHVFSQCGPIVPFFNFLQGGLLSGMPERMVHINNDVTPWFGHHWPGPFAVRDFTEKRHPRAEFMVYEVEACWVLALPVCLDVRAVHLVFGQRSVVYNV